MWGPSWDPWDPCALKKTHHLLREKKNKKKKRKKKGQTNPNPSRRSRRSSADHPNRQPIFQPRR
uniref:Uncharacterized protein n=1 Tax=Cucumis melo TaxID=3656 RepID=A0A9I9E1Z7_CUCME